MEKWIARDGEKKASDLRIKIEQYKFESGCFLCYKCHYRIRHPREKVMKQQGCLHEFFSVALQFTGIGLSTYLEISPEFNTVLRCYLFLISVPFFCRFAKTLF